MVESFLDIGCGGRPNPKATHLVDVRTVNRANFVRADVVHLPFRDEAFDYVYASHVLEHFSFRETARVVTEWLRVLKIHGKLEVIVPNLRSFRIAKKLLLYSLDLTMDDQGMFYGGQDFPENFHKAGFTYRSLELLLEKSGIRVSSRVCGKDSEYLLILPFIGNPGINRFYHLIRLHKILKTMFPRFSNECHMIGLKVQCNIPFQTSCQEATGERFCETSPNHQG